MKKKIVSKFQLKLDLSWDTGSDGEVALHKGKIAESPFKKMAQAVRRAKEACPLDRSEIPVLLRTGQLTFEDHALLQKADAEFRGPHKINQLRIGENWQRRIELASMLPPPSIGELVMKDVREGKLRII
jgi:hypothetical protein